MGKGHLFSTIVTLLIICGAIAMEAKSIPPPWVGKDTPPEPVKGLWKFLRQCGRTLTNECGQVVYDYVFYVRDNITKDCCKKLVKMGEKCNRAAAYSLSHVIKFKPWRGNIYERSVEAYNICLKGNGKPLKP
ncbi:hypothetical protein CDL15_Pgr012514 [Punica granatum]|uniref:Prolamin-like domain-containing protein n=2 Tax=Punica granatum TaxID=22663 RepID=A0A218XXT6_PUNGR|nr:hypothetical protein CDL15_Pgr012514 [Punica granatum]